MSDRGRVSLREGAYTDEYLIGYRAPVYQALWKRILRWGAPRVLSYLWVALCLWLSLTCLFAQRWWWILGVGGVWMLVQAMLVMLTQWDLQFETILRETPKYHANLFDAG